MSAGGPRVGSREAVVTLAVCVLLGWEVLSNLLFTFVFLLGMELSPYTSFYDTLGYQLLASIPGVVLGGVLGVVLLRQGGVRVPSRGERGATRGAIVGVVVGLALSFFISVPMTSGIGLCALIGLAVGRIFDGAAMRQTSA